MPTSIICNDLNMQIKPISAKSFIKPILLAVPYIFLVFVLLVSVAAPLLEYQRLEVSRNFFAITHKICNQLPTRCLFIFTSPMALCARCFAIYLSMLVVGVLTIVVKKNIFNWKLGILLMIPCIIDGSTQYLGQRLSNNGLRLATGTLAGIGIGLIFFPLYFRFIDRIFQRR
jgi:uncharacterized membrane protein